MNRHQVLTGACNQGDQCFAVGSVGGIHFTAYAAGCDIVILASDFQRVQIIPGVTHGNIRVSCIDCSMDTGKIAATYNKKVYIFEPSPLISADSNHKLDYRWSRSAVITADAKLFCLSWNPNGSRLLTGGEVIQMWEVREDIERDHIMFVVGDPIGECRDDVGHKEETTQWLCVWSCRPASVVYHMDFSPDGLLFATAGKSDRLVKIWYEDKKAKFPRLTWQESACSIRRDELNYSFIYIAHPRAVTGFSWRKTSNYMPQGSVANMIMTCCRDNICRLWCETVLPDDGLVDLEQFDGGAGGGNIKYHTQRYRRRFMNRLKHIRQEITRRKRQMDAFQQTDTDMSTFPSLQSVHEFHKFGVHHAGISQTFHFHLAASINPETDIPLLPTVSSRGSSDGEDANFRLHWLNNKELQFTLDAERIMADLQRRCATEKNEFEFMRRKSSAVAMDVGEGESAGGSEVNDDLVSGHLRRKGRYGKQDSCLSARSSISHASVMTQNTASIDQTEDRINGAAGDIIDTRLEALLRDWHQSADMLFTVHPVDGSLLVWLVDWLDEYTPYCFRQAQVSFSSRIPHAFPVPDSRTMATNFLVYCNYNRTPAAEKTAKFPQARSTSRAGEGDDALDASLRLDDALVPNVSIVSKHHNGTLNQWRVCFAESSKFSTILSVSHLARACGHRFRINSTACHPVLPLLLTTSHHNVPDEDAESPSSDDGSSQARDAVDLSCDMNCDEFAFCSELILWRVEPVGPLSKSGGIIEIARINSKHLTSFSNVAWIPTLLPCSSLGQLSNSPSALFVASDGECLRMYQAVIDARTLLMDMSPYKAKSMSFSSSNSSGYIEETPPIAPPAPSTNQLRIVSMQSTARPGCIIELDALADACQDWQNTQLLHVFQEQLICGNTGHMWHVGDIKQSPEFIERFFLVVLEKGRLSGSLLHMWSITIVSQQEESKLNQTQYVPDAQIFQADEGDADSSSSYSPHNHPQDYKRTASAVEQVLSFTTTKVCTQTLPLPANVEVLHASVAAGHHSSASIYPACFAPYIISTACSDGKVRFWKCNVETVSEVTGRDSTGRTSTYRMDRHSSTGEIGGGVVDEKRRLEHREEVNKLVSFLSGLEFVWSEWSMLMHDRGASIIQIPGKPISVSCAYSGRVAIAYRYGSIRTTNDNPNNKFVNLCVAIYECESTGGSEWTLEDTIELKNITIPDPKAEIDVKTMMSPEANNIPVFAMNVEHLNESPMSRTKSIPSLSTLQSIRHYIAKHGNRDGILVQKQLIQLDWVSTEDGAHILTVGVGTKIFMYSQVSNEIAMAYQKEAKNPMKVGAAVVNKRSRPLLQKSKTMVAEDKPEEIRWMRLRTVELTSADGLPPLPMNMCWVRAGILVVGLDNEVHVYSQWRDPELPDATPAFESSLVDKRNLTELSLSSLATGTVLNTPSLRMSQSMLKLSPGPMTPRRYDACLRGQLAKTESTASMSLINDCGLFEAAHRANPVLPQYHPKQLMELLNFGKVKRVKAILAHLCRCISGMDESANDDIHDQQTPKAFHRQRTFSLSATNIADASTDGDIGRNTEIFAIPPLPLYALLAADYEQACYHGDLSPGGVNAKTTQQDYADLFNGPCVEDELYVPFQDDDAADMKAIRGRIRSNSPTPHNINHFGPHQSRLLAKHLTQRRLPGLSSLDQMYLLALADTVANTKTDFSDRFTLDTVKVSSLADSSQRATESVDDCGLRFLLAMRHHMYLLRTLPPRQRVNLQMTGLKTFNIVWAFHSESTEELLSLIPSVQKGEPSWSDLKQFGAGWWVTNGTTLKSIIEKVAKAAFHKNKDPLDAAMFYLSLKKKNVLWGLFRSVSDQKMSNFFRNNFGEDRWRKAALKNAFALLGRQRFMHAAAFFLLAGSLADAVEVCIDKLKDIQLALVMCRLYESDEALPGGVKKILYEKILGCDSNGMNHSPSRAHPDPFLRSVACWILKDTTGALNTLLQTGIGQSHIVEEQDDLESYSTSPNVFNFYNYLRTHPLLIRLRIANSAQEKKQSMVVIAGLEHTDANVNSQQNMTYVDRITPHERRLFFQTAHMHFKAGCPALALEVLSKLPSVTVPVDDGDELSVNSPSHVNEKSIATGLIVADENTAQMSKTAGKWREQENNRAGATDWGAPIIEFEDKLDLNFSSDNSSEESDNLGQYEGDVPTTRVRPKFVHQDSHQSGTLEPILTGTNREDFVDIMAQQYKFIACLKIMMEELSTLATGFEVDGGQLRYQLYIWLEKEVETLKALCHYERSADDFPAEREHTDIRRRSVSHKLSIGSSTASNPARPTLHDVILAEKMDFEAKIERMSRRQQWLKSNQRFLRTLISYCVLQGSGGGGLASVRMELILLLQELQQVQPQMQQHLLSPLPFPTTLPLLSASIASSKTVIADPIQHLQGMIQDLLHTIVEFTSPPSQNYMFDVVILLRNLSVALSACIYQCLCDSDNFFVNLSNKTNIAMDSFTSHNIVYGGHLMSSVKQKHLQATADENINTPPAKWPGVSSLRVLLAREKDDDSPKLNILLCEALVAVYVSLLVNGLASFDPHMLYRLVAHTFNEKMWASLFGGGIKTQLKVINTPRTKPTSDELAKQRMKLHMKVMGSGSGLTGSKAPVQEGKRTFKEKFLPPDVSMVTYFMTKPSSNASNDSTVYDSDENLSSSEEDSDDDLDGDERTHHKHKRSVKQVQEHIDHSSYSWCIMRYAIIKHTTSSLELFLPQVGIDIQGRSLLELPVLSPLLHAILKMLWKWEEQLKFKLDQFPSAPDDYIPQINLESYSNQPFAKYRAILDPNNTPFADAHAALPIKRLWHKLIKKENLRDIFFRYIYKRPKVTADCVDSGGERDSDVTSSDGPSESDPIKIIHKEQDIIASFAINQVVNSSNLLSLSTQKELVELDIGSILNPPQWLGDDTEYDIELMKSNMNYGGESTDFLVVETPMDRTNPLFHSRSYDYTQNPGMTAGQTGRGGSVIVRRQVTGVRRMGAHPFLPHYLSGSTDGSVRMWEWGHIQPLTILRHPGSFPKVTKLSYSAQGNKACVSDSEGSMCLWQVGPGSNFNKPIMSLQCHNKTTSDFAFVGSSSLLATAGHSSDGKNVCLWDTLLPKRHCLVHAFMCHEHGSPAIVYAPQHQILLSGGRKGEICMFDMRQRVMRHTFQAHEAPIKCLSLDPDENYFVTGSADGDIKVWGLDVHQLLHSFPAEHSKNTFFRNMASATGVTQVLVGPQSVLLSCGVDGSLKFRKLPDHDVVVNTWP